MSSVAPGLTLRDGALRPPMGGRLAALGEHRSRRVSVWAEVARASFCCGLGGLCRSAQTFAARPIVWLTRRCLGKRPLPLRFLFVSLRSVFRVRAARACQVRPAFVAFAMAQCKVAKLHSEVLPVARQGFCLPAIRWSFHRIRLLPCTLLQCRLAKRTLFGFSLHEVTVLAIGSGGLLFEWEVLEALRTSCSAKHTSCGVGSGVQG